MNKKRKTPVFSAIVLRVLEMRFQEIVRVKLITETAFELTLKGRTDTESFTVQLDNYLTHLVSEFGEEELSYSFRIFQSAKLRTELTYNNTNNINELTVNLYQNQHYGNYGESSPAN
ncbi:hypothetical protein ACXZ1K_15965 [Pedobacter sp. PWIIR3]